MAIFQLGPHGAQRRKILRRSLTLIQTITREGPIAFAGRKVAQAAHGRAERARIKQFNEHAWLPDGRPVFLLVRHNCGGGTERHVHSLAALLLQEGVRPILVRPGPKGCLIWEEHAPSGEIAWCRASAPDRGSLRHCLELVRPVHSHVHHLSGVPGALVELLQERRIPYDWTIHDYHAICPRIHLIGARGVYCGEPEAAACNACLSRHGDDNGNAVSESITVWRERFGRHLSGARRVFVPSDDAATRIRRYLPTLPVTLRPHPEIPENPGLIAKQPLPGEPVRVVVLGTIVRAKGSERLLACARDARARRLPLEFQIVGITDRNAQFRRLKNVCVSGRYREAEVFERLAATSGHLAFLPTVCPESFMYTLSTVMAAGFYTVCYDLGAQAERLRAWGWGRVLPLETEPQTVNEALLDAACTLAANRGAPPVAPPPAVYPDALHAYYGFSSQELEELTISPQRRPAGSGATPHRPERTIYAHIY